MIEDLDDVVIPWGLSTQVTRKMRDWRQRRGLRPPRRAWDGYGKVNAQRREHDAKRDQKVDA